MMLDVTKELLEKFNSLSDEDKVKEANKMTKEEIEALHEVGGYVFNVNDGRISEVVKEEGIQFKDGVEAVS